MSKTRDYQIRRLILASGFIGRAKSVSVDQDGRIFAYHVPADMQESDADSWRAIGRSTYIGRVKPFAGDGWRKYLYDISNIEIAKVAEDS